MNNCKKYKPFYLLKIFIESIFVFLPFIFHLISYVQNVHILLKTTTKKLLLFLTIADRWIFISFLFILFVIIIYTRYLLYVLNIFKKYVNTCKYCK